MIPRRGGGLNFTCRAQIRGAFAGRNPDAEDAELRGMVSGHEVALKRIWPRANMLRAGAHVLPV